MISGVSAANQYQLIIQQGQNGRVDPSSPVSARHLPDNDQAAGAQKKSDAVQVSEEAREMYASSQAKSSVEENEMGLTADEQAEVDRLKAIDRRVRAHEQAHVAAGGNLITKGASFEYETGPDGKRYAVAGEVSIDASKEKDPEATLRKAARVRAAAMAPADPSPQDRRVAAEAGAMAREASAEIARESSDEASQMNTGEGIPGVKPDEGNTSQEGTSKVSAANRSNEEKPAQAVNAGQGNQGVAGQYHKNMMASAAVAYQGTFHMTEPAINRTVFA